MGSDPASLANLHDIVQIPPPSWWPVAVGWYVLFAVLLIALIWFVYRRWHHYRCNGYRRAAMTELMVIEAASGENAIKGLPALLKRTALHAYSREQIAALSGKEWREFLNGHCEADPFKGTAGELLDTLSYHPADLKQTDSQVLIDSTRIWIKYHRAGLC